MKIVRCFVLCVVGSIAWIGMQASQAADKYWAAAASGNFTNGTMWTGGLVPGGGDRPFFDKAGTYTVTFTAGYTNNSLRVDYGDVTFDLNGNTYTITNTGSRYPIIGGVSGKTAKLSITNGTLKSKGGPAFYVGGASSTGILEVAGSGSILDTLSDGSLNVRQYGQLNVSGGGVVTSKTSTVGGRATVTTGGKYSATISIGSTSAGWGTGELWITNGGLVYANSAGSSYFWVGQGYRDGLMVVADPGSVVRANVTYPEVSQTSSNAQVIVTNGGLFQCTGNLLLGYAASTAKTGTLTVVGNGARFEGGIYMGNSTAVSPGLLRIGNGGVAAVKNLYCYEPNCLVDVAPGGTLILTNNTSVFVNMYPGSVLKGGGVIRGDKGTAGTYYLYNQGTISPGSPLGTLMMSNVLVRLDQYNPLGLLRIEVGGAAEGEYDRFSTAIGDITTAKFYRGGTCEVAFVNGFVPEIGDTFDILDWTDLGDTDPFADVVLPDITPDWWVTNNLYVNGEISVDGIPPPLGTLIMLN